MYYNYKIRKKYNKSKQNVKYSYKNEMIHKNDIMYIIAIKLRIIG